MLEEAAGDSGRRVILQQVLSQGEDHPAVLTIPETGYLKGAVLNVVSSERRKLVDYLARPNITLAPCPA